MASIVPGRGWTVADQGEGVEARHVVMGPFAEGDYIRRVTIGVWCTANGEINIALSIGPSGEASREALNNGTPLISRGRGTVGTIPSLNMHVGGYVGANLWLPVGIRGSVGARFIVTELAYRTVDVNYAVLLGTSVMRFEREPRGMAP